MHMQAFFYPSLALVFYLSHVSSGDVPMFCHNSGGKHEELSDGAVKVCCFFFLV